MKKILLFLAAFGFAFLILGLFLSFAHLIAVAVVATVFASLMAALMNMADNYGYGR